MAKKNSRPYRPKVRHPADPLRGREFTTESTEKNKKQSEEKTRTLTNQGSRHPEVHRRWRRYSASTEAKAKARESLRSEGLSYRIRGAG